MKPQLVLAPLLALACSYDFDRYALPSGEPVAGGGEGGELSSGGSAGEAGAATVGTSGASAAGKGGTGGAGGKGGSAGATGGGTGGTASAGDTGQGGESGETGAGRAGSAGAGGAGTGGESGFDCAAVSGTTFGGRCYFAVGGGAGLPFTGALAACAENDGAALVAITSAEEQAALEAAFFPSATDFWIGLSLEGAPEEPAFECSFVAEACPFEWVSGEDLGFTDWALRGGDDDEPNYSGACVRIQAADLAWADYDCTQPLSAICER